MHTLKQLIVLATTTINIQGAYAVEVQSGKTAGILWVENTHLRAEYEPDTADLRVINLGDGSLALDHLDWWVASPDGAPALATLFAGKDGLPEMKLERQRKDGMEESLLVHLKPNDPTLEFSVTVSNHGTNDLHIKEFGVRGMAFPGCDFPDYRTLDGESSGYATHVSEADYSTSLNNLLATFGPPGGPKHSLVIGGLHYQEFMRLCEITKTPNGLGFKVKGEDPYGKLVNAGMSYDFSDTIYVDALTNNRFEALEDYGRALAKSNEVHINVPDVPIVNLWYPQDKRFGGSFFTNNTPGAVWAVNDAKHAGFLKYGPIGVRLEPDDYSAPNNAQGWWDDAHFQKYHSGQFLPPYETAVKWGAAMKAAGGIPFIYFQTARRSEDFCRKFPEQMLYKNPDEKRPTPIEWFKDKYWSYDFTDPDFIAHMHDVYSNLQRAGVRGVKFDYPTTGWDYLGGFEDPSATTGSAYRNIFKLASDGLGNGSEVQERLGAAGDITLGAVTTMRIQEDTDKLYPPMVTKAGLRWYKNRVAVHYDLDAKNPDHAVPGDSIDGVRAMFTMMTVVSGRLELGKYIGELTGEQRQALSKVTPLYLGPKSARPIDAFSGKDFPQIYDLEVKPGWHQLAFYNTAIDGKWPTDWETIIQPLQGRLLPATIGVDLGRSTDDGGLGLDASKRYYVFDFWNDRFVGVFKGSDSLTQQLRPGEARMMSVHEVLNRPQIISTDRHVLQGVVDLQRCEWLSKGNRLMGASLLAAGEPYTLIVAANGFHVKGVSATGAKAESLPRTESPDLLAVHLLSVQGGWVKWQIRFQ